MGRIFGAGRACSRQAQQEADDNLEYPPLPRGLLRLIYEGRGLQIIKRSQTYLVMLEGVFIHADDLNISKWLLKKYGEKLDAEKFELACSLLGERIKSEVYHYQRMARIAEREEAKALTSTWGNGNNLTEFFGR